MIAKYKLLKETYTKNGYQDALELIQQFDTSSPQNQIIQTNFYCYLVIQKDYKTGETANILKACLERKQCKGALKALTKYHLAQAEFKSNIKLCQQICKEIVNEFLGEYYGLKIREDRSQKEEESMHSLQQIIYYCFLLLAYACSQEERHSEAESFIKASKKLLRERQKSFEYTGSYFHQTEGKPTFLIDDRSV